MSPYEKHLAAIEAREEAWKATLTDWTRPGRGERWTAVPKGTVRNWGWNPPDGAVEGSWYCLPDLSWGWTSKGGDKAFLACLKAEVAAGVMRPVAEVLTAAARLGVTVNRLPAPYRGEPARKGRKATQKAPAPAEVIPATPAPAERVAAMVEAFRADLEPAPVVRPLVITEDEIMAVISGTLPAGEEINVPALSLAAVVAAEAIGILVRRKVVVDLSVDEGMAGAVEGWTGHGGASAPGTGEILGTLFDRALV